MLAKMLNIIQNGYEYYFPEVTVRNVGFSTIILDILWKENLIKGYTVMDDGSLKVLLRYHEGVPICKRLVLLSKPGDRFYLSALDISRVPYHFGVLIVSTPKGIMIGKEAVRRGSGGEVLAYVE